MMTNPTCPNCKGTIQHRHTHMTSFPVTLVCTECGSWLKLDAPKRGNLLAFLPSLFTVALAFFSPYFLILLPLCFLVSVGPIQNLSVELIKKRQSEMLRQFKAQPSVLRVRNTQPLSPDCRIDDDLPDGVRLSHKLLHVRPFRAPAVRLNGALIIEAAAVARAGTMKAAKSSAVANGLPN